MNERMTETSTRPPALRPEPALGVKVAKTDAPFWVKLVSAGTGACLADVVTFPLDTTKVRLQVGYNIPILNFFKVYFIFLHLPYIYKQYLKINWSFLFSYICWLNNRFGFFQILQTLSLSLNIYTGTGWRNHDKALNTQYYAIYTLCLTLLFINTSIIDPL